MFKQLSPAEARTSQMYLQYLDQLKQVSKVNRKNPTPAEKIFWDLVIGRDKLKYRFLRQKPIGRCIIDFYCSVLLLDIEIDGDSHDFKKGWDEARDEYLEIRGIKTIRYKNNEVLNDTDEVILDLKEKIQQREKELSLTPSFSKRG
jgi:very-short-patch-repair endonuclease